MAGICADLTAAIAALMSDTIDGAFNRREFVRGSMSAAALAAFPALLAAAAEAEADKAAVLAQIPKMHAETVHRLQEWIALPSIAAENRNYPQGPEYMTHANHGGLRVDDSR